MTVTANSSSIETWPKNSADVSSVGNGQDVAGTNGQKDRFLSVVATIGTMFFVYGIFLLQGVLVARLLGPLGRGEFGTAMYLPRDILLYTGLLGGVEIVNSYASKRFADSIDLKYSAMRLGLVSGLITALVSAIISTVMLCAVGKSYLLPYCLICCFFLPWEHIHHVVSAVDRGCKDFFAFNLNRVLFALAFPLMVALAFGIRLYDYLPVQHPKLLLVTLVFVLSRFVGLLPTLRGMRLLPTFLNWWRNAGTRKRESAAGCQHGPDAANSSQPEVKQLLIEGKPYAFSVFATELFERLDGLLIVLFATVEASGHYFVAVPAAALLTVIPNALGVFSFNAGADPTREFSIRRCIVFLVATGFVQVVTTLVFCLIVPTLISFAFGTVYEPAIPFVLALAPACAIKGFLQTVDGFLKGRGKPLLGVWSRIISILGMLSFFALTYERFGLMSIPYAACFGQGISMVILTTAVILEVHSDSKPVEDIN